MKFVIFLLSILTFSCHIKTKSSVTREKVWSPLSLWLVQNEDTLFRSLSEWVRKDTLQNKVDGELTFREYPLTDGIYGALNDRIHSIDKCIHVIYMLRPKKTPYFEIFLTSEFDTACVKSIDTIFRDIDTLRHFRIVKYRPPMGPFSKWVMETDTIDPKDIAFKLIPINSKYDIVIYLKKSTTAETKEQLKDDIFGEEFLLKHVRSIKFQRLTDSTKETITIDGVRLMLDTK